jgi:hypothetical protein
LQNIKGIDIFEKNVVYCMLKILIAIFNFYSFSPGGSMNSSMFDNIMEELPALINESDLHVSQVGYRKYKCTRFSEK